MVVIPWEFLRKYAGYDRRATSVPRSVKRKLSALRSFYKFLLRQKKVKRDITARIVPPKADKPLPVFFRPTEMVERHAAQLRGKPDPVLGKKRICQFGNFVRAVLIHE